MGQHSWTLDEEHSREIIRRGLDLGVNFYDTAIAYQSGTSEQYVGRALRDFGRRDDLVVATKFLPGTPEEIENGISGQQYIENMINTSLNNLGMNYVDLELSDAEIRYLEEPYLPHPLAGVMAQNKRNDAARKHVWSTGDQKIQGSRDHHRNPRGTG